MWEMEQLTGLVARIRLSRSLGAWRESMALLNEHDAAQCAHHTSPNLHLTFT
jgi:hypothetical protein